MTIFTKKLLNQFAEIDNKVKTAQVQPEDKRSKARKAFNDALVAYDAKDWNKALSLFQSANQLIPNERVTAFIDDIVNNKIDAGQSAAQEALKIQPSTKSQEQTVAKTSDKEKQSLEIALSLLTKLERKYNPKASGVEEEQLLGSESGTAPQLFAGNLRKIDDFLRWAAENKITWKGKRIVWTNEELKAGLAPADALAFDVKSYNRADRDADTNETKLSEFAGSRQDLIPAVESIRDSKSYKDNKVFQVMFRKIIGELNNWLKASGQKTINPLSSTDTGVSQSKDAEKTLDGFTASTLDPNNPFAGLKEGLPWRVTPPFPLKYKDLQSTASLMSWLKSKKYADGKDIIGIDANPCEAIHVLYKRAVAINRVAASYESEIPGFTALASFYLKQITSLGQTIQGLDGKACAVVSPTTKDTDKKDSSDKDGKDSRDRDSRDRDDHSRDRDGHSRDEDSGDLRISLEYVVSQFPLRVKDVNLLRIDNFFRAYAKIVGKNYKGELGVCYQEYQNSMNALKTHLQNPSKTDFILENTQPKDITMTWALQPAGNHYMPILQFLYKIIGSTEEALSLFQKEYDDHPTDERAGLSSDGHTKLQAQIGTSSASIASQNKFALSNLMRRFAAALATTKGMQ